MVVVKLWGGLGNQLFQYFFGKFIAKERNIKVEYFFDNVLHNNTDKSILKLFNDIHVVEEKEVFKNNIIIKNKNIYRIFRKLNQLFPFLHRKVYIENNFFYKNKLPAKSNVFDGYWQSFRYLNNFNYEYDFEKHKKIFLYNSEYINLINSSNSVSLHIRRGDYLNSKNRKIYYNCDLDYYRKAINIISSKISNPVFFIFSNDINWIRQEFMDLEGINKFFVDNSHSENSAIKDLFLMSSCKHQILANSTFSWWGAYLNPFIEKIVIAPKNWYNGNLNETTIDLIPPNWIRI